MMTSGPAMTPPFPNISWLACPAFLALSTDPQTPDSDLILAHLPDVFHPFTTFVPCPPVKTPQTIPIINSGCNKLMTVRDWQQLCDNAAH